MWVANKEGTTGTSFDNASPGQTDTWEYLYLLHAMGLSSGLAFCPLDHKFLSLFSFRRILSLSIAAQYSTLKSMKKSYPSESAGSWFCRFLSFI